MKKVKIVLFYLLCLLVIGCASKKSLIEKVSEVKSDTIYSKIETITRPPILSSLTIEEVCDTITGKPKHFKQVFVVGQDTLELSIDNNNLRLNISQLEQIIKERDSIYKASKSETKTSLEENTVEYKTPKWCWYTLLVVLIFILFPIIPSTINSIARKLIGLF